MPKISTPIRLPKQNGSTATPDMKPRNNADNLDENKENEINKNGSLNGSYVNDPDRPLADEPPPRYILERKDSLNDMTDSEDEGEGGNVFNESYLHNANDRSVDAEAVYIDALQNEVKQLQVCFLFLCCSWLFEEKRV